MTFLLSLINPPTALAEKTQARTALVIGNGQYEGSGRLKNSINDASDIAKALKDTGFDVIKVINANQRVMEDAIREFGEKLEKRQGVGLFYYAGHGVQAKGVNYLIPIKSSNRIKREKDLKYAAVDINQIMDEMSNANNGFNIVILDACRNNPLSRNFRRSTGIKGLARMNSPTGTLLAYATAPGKEAFDGYGKNGLYTKHLLNNIKKPGLALESVFKNVLKSVKAESKNEQIPWVSSFTGDFYFVAGGSIIEKRSVNITPKKTILRKGTVSVKTRPNGGIIRLNGGRVGTAPVSLPLTSGQYTISAEKQGFTKTEEKIFVLPGQDQSITLLLGTKEDNNYPTEYEFRVYRTPSDAKVRILNINPTYYDGMRLKSGDYHIEVSKWGYNKVKQWVTIGAADKTVKVTLKKQPTLSTDDSIYQTVHVKGGCFQMGSAKYDNEKPIHKVCIDDFRMGKYEVTVGQFKKFVTVTGYQGDGRNGWGCKDGIMKPEGFIYTSNLPAVCISWEDATDYANWLSQKTGKNYRLPTEAEWEYACRSGGMEKEYCGRNSLDELGWYNENSNSKWHPVGKKEANGLGLYDMSGNVWEWVQDRYDENYYSRSPTRNPKGPSEGSKRVIRGGSSHFNKRNARSAKRKSYNTDIHLFYIGVRLVRQP